MIALQIGALAALLIGATLPSIAIAHSEDLSAARLSARWAMWAAIIAIVAAAIATKEQIHALIIS